MSPQERETPFVQDKAFTRYKGSFQKDKVTGRAPSQAELAMSLGMFVKGEQ